MMMQKNGRVRTSRQNLIHFAIRCHREKHLSRGQLAALSRRIPWANRLFSKSMKGKILNFLHEVEKMIATISVQV